jgi:formyltetrahydrofolate deformylase
MGTEHAAKEDLPVTTHILRIDCPDAPGLVYKITGSLFRAGFNILSNHEFVEAATEHFFMRTAFTGEASPEGVAEDLQAILHPAAIIRLTRSEPQRIVVFATKEPHCLGDLLLRHAYGELPASIQAVVSNYDSLAPLVRQFGIPFHHVSHLGLDRAAHEQGIHAVLDQYAPAYLVLAKYMRILTPGFVARYADRIINIHHSFLPAFMGAQPYQQAYDRGVKIIGATAHIVTDELDTGPIIAQSILPVDHSYTAADMAQAGRDAEKIVLAKAVKLILEERVFLYQNRTIIFE